MKCSCGSELKFDGLCPNLKCPWSNNYHPNFWKTLLSEGGVFYQAQENVYIIGRMSDAVERYFGHE